MKPKTLIASTGVLLLSILVLAALARPVAQARGVARQDADKGSTPVASDSSDIISTANELTAKWLDQLGNDGWLFVSYKDELLGSLGIDPETGWPLANKALWEHWYELDSDGRPASVLVRHTDLERGNVTRVVWTDGVLLRDPSGVKEDGHQWEIYRPIVDHFCNSKLSETLRYSGEVVGEVSEDWTEDANGNALWVVTMKVTYPPVSTADVSGEPNTYIATETTCTRNAETGAVVNSDHVFITLEDDRLLYQRTYEYVVTRVPQPPAEMLDLLDKLVSKP
jgi:hypothetical protein